MDYQTNYQTNCISYQGKLENEYEKTTELIAKEIALIEESQFKVECFKEHAAEIIKKVPMFISFERLEDLWRNFDHNTKKFAGANPENDKGCEKYLIREYFFPKQAKPKLERIMIMGHDNIGIEFEYTVKNASGNVKTMTITIPNFGVANKTNYYSLYYEAALKTSESVYTSFSKSLDQQTVVKAIKEELGYVEEEVK